MTNAIINGLMKRRAVLAGEIRTLQSSLAHLDATIKLFQGNHKPTVRGNVTRRMLDVLREAREPLSTRKIADRLGNSATVKQVGIALNGQRRKGVVRSQKDGKVVQWELARHTAA